MIIDAHAHVTAPDKLYAYKAMLVSHRGAHGKGSSGVTAAHVEEALDEPLADLGNISHRQHLDESGLDVQIISPRPFQMMHSETPSSIVEWWTAEVNDTIALSCEVEPRFRGLAGLPQSMDLTPAQWANELRRCVTELGFLGGIVNPDPYEGLRQPPAIGDRFWYPLWEAFCELDVPVYIHSAGCRPPARENYSLHFVQEETLAVVGLLNSRVLDDFPDLKVVVSHGGGAIPYQKGRFYPAALKSGVPFEERMRRIWYDTCMYSRDSIEFLIRTVGVDRCVFGTEKPGTGSVKDPVTGRWLDDIHHLIGDIEWLTDEERSALLEGNARSLFKIEA